MNNQSKKGKGVSPVVAGIAGAVVGGAAVAAAVVLRDKKNRKKVTDALDAAKEKASDYVEAVKSHPQVKEGAQKLKEAVNMVKDKIEDKMKG